MLKETSLPYKLSQKTFHHQRSCKFSKMQSVECHAFVDVAILNFKFIFIYLFIYFFVLGCGSKYLLFIQGGVKNFCLRGQVTALIYLSRQVSIHKYTYTHFFYYIYTHKYTLFYLISYIYTHIQQKKKKQDFQSKLCLIAIFHKIKFIFTI